jgi:hypothetical protein
MTTWQAGAQKQGTGCIVKPGAGLAACEHTYPQLGPQRGGVSILGLGRDVLGRFEQLFLAFTRKNGLKSPSIMNSLLLI